MRGRRYNFYGGGPNKSIYVLPKMWEQVSDKHYCPECLEKIFKLKDCPFCGSDRVKLCWDTVSLGDLCQTASVLCTNCGVSSKSCRSANEMEAKMEVIRIWNRRAGDFVI